MSLFSNLFGGGQEAPAQQTQQTQQSQEPPAGQEPTQQAQQEPQQTNSGGGDSGNVSPLDAYKDLWNNESTGKDGESGNDADPLSDPSAMFNIDPKSIQEAVGKINFAEAVKPEHMQAITEGGEGAQQAFLESMNAVARQVFSQSMVGSAKLVEQALARAGQGIDSRIDGRLRSSQVSETVAEANPAFNHPAAKPMVQALQQQLAAKHPTASPKEISDMAKSYFNDFASSITAPEKAAKQKETDAGQQDWDAWLNS